MEMTIGVDHCLGAEVAKAEDENDALEAIHGVASAFGSPTSR